MKKGKNGAGLHQWIATGNSPKTYEGTKGVTPATVPNIKKKKVITK